MHVYVCDDSFWTCDTRIQLLTCRNSMWKHYLNVSKACIAFLLVPEHTPSALPKQSPGMLRIACFICVPRTLSCYPPAQACPSGSHQPWGPGLYLSWTEIYQRVLAEDGGTYEVPPGKWSSDQRRYLPSMCVSWRGHRLLTDALWASVSLSVLWVSFALTTYLGTQVCQLRCFLNMVLGPPASETPSTHPWASS